MYLVNVIQMKRRTPSLVLLIGMALLTSACSTEKQQWDFPEFLGVSHTPIAPDPPCSVTGAGYFRSNTPGKFYRCLYTDYRWVKYNFSCPGTQNFNQSTQKCE